ncbi:MAG: MATE family efflux transporter [Ruminococcaceae bacterium]|nr:MATE family efflux transporter [Oscillospiraceae bacterium]
MSHSEIRDFTRGSIPKQLVIFATPLFLSNLLQVLYNMVDMIIVGMDCGTVGISAVSVGGDVSQLMTFAAMGFSNAGQVLIARLIGGGKQEKIGRFVGTMSSFLFLCAVVISVLGLVFQDGILTLMSTPSGAWQGAAEYSAVCMAGLVFIYGYNIVSAILRGMGDSKHPFVFIGIAAGTNVILDLILVLGFHLGPFGAAIATVASQAFSFLCSLVFLIRAKERFALNVSRTTFFRWDKEMLLDLVKLGVPMAIKTASIQVSKLFVNSWVNSYGVEISAFAGIINKIASFSNLFSASINVAGSTMAGQNIAAGKYRRVKKIMGSIAVITLSIAALLSAITLLFPDFVFSLFSDDPKVLALVDGFLPIAVLLYLGSALRAIMNALLNGSGNYPVNFVTAIFDGIVMRIGLALLFGLGCGMAHYGFWLGDALAGFTPFFIGIVFYFSGKWKNGKPESDSE